MTENHFDQGSANVGPFRKGDRLVPKSPPATLQDYQRWIGSGNATRDRFYRKMINQREQRSTRIPPEQQMTGLDLAKRIIIDHPIGKKPKYFARELGKVNRLVELPFFRDTLPPHLSEDVHKSVTQALQYEASLRHHITHQAYHIYAAKHPELHTTVKMGEDEYPDYLPLESLSKKQRADFYQFVEHDPQFILQYRDLVKKVLHLVQIPSVSVKYEPALLPLQSEIDAAQIAITRRLLPHVSPEDMNFMYGDRLTLSAAVDFEAKVQGFESRMVPRK